MFLWQWMSIRCIFSDRDFPEASLFPIPAMRVHPVVHFFAKNAVRLFLLAVFVGIPAAMIYLRVVGIGFGAPEALGRALSSETVGVSIGRLAFDPFAGLIAEDVVAREADGDRRMLARLGDLVVSLNLSDLAARQISVDRLFLEGTSVSIPVGDEPDSERVEIEDVHAEVIFTGDQVRLSRFEGKFEGIRVMLTGQFLNPQVFRLPKASEGPKQARHEEWLDRVIENLARLRFPEGAPTLRAELEADFAKRDSLRVNGLSLRSAAVHGPGWTLREIDLQAEYADGQAKVPRLLVRDARGLLEASAEWTRVGGAFDAAVVSSLDVQPLLEAAAGRYPALGGLKTTAPPQLEVRVTGTPTAERFSVLATGMAAIPGVDFKGAELRKIGFDFAWKDGTFYARDVKVSCGDGLLHAKLLVEPGGFKLDATNSIPPTRLLGLFDENTRKFLSAMEFKDLPDLRVSLRGTKPSFDAIRGEGKMKLGRTAMRGSWIDSGEADFEIADRCVTYRNIVMRRGAGRGTGTFAYDVGRREARLEGIKSTLMPFDVLLWIDPKIADGVAPYRFREPPSATVNGMVHLKDATKNNLNLTVESAEGLDYDLLGKTLSFGKTSAVVDIIGTKVRANVKRAALMEGDISLKALVSIDAKDPTFGADVRVNRVNFADLTRLYFNYDSSKGVMSGRYKFDARVGQETRMRGDGSIRVEDGNVFAIPVLGPFSEILGTILPGVGYESARLATADFTVADQKIHTDNFEIEGTGFSMYGAGDIHFVSNKLDMSMRINARGIPGLVFYPVSKLFEYVSTGTVADPQWRPKLIPRFGNGAPATPPKPGRR